MKYCSLDQLELYYGTATDKAVCFTESNVAFTDKPQFIWIPRSLLKVAYQNESEFTFFIPSWFYMNELKCKLYHNNFPKHGTEEQIKKVYTGFINYNEAEWEN